MNKTELTELARTLGYSITPDMEVPDIKALIMKGPRQKVSKWQVFATLVGFLAALAGCAGAVAAWKSAHASAQVATTSESEMKKGKILQLQQVVIIDILEKSASSPNSKPLTFEQIKQAYIKEVIQDKKWTEELAEQPLDTNRLKLLLLNLVSLNIAYAVQPQAKPDNQGGPTEMEYIFSKSSLNPRFSQFQTIAEAKERIIKKLFGQVGPSSFDDLKKFIVDHKTVNETDWAIIVTELVAENIIRIDKNKKIWLVAFLEIQVATPDPLGGIPIKPIKE